MPIALTTIEELRKLFRAVKHAGTDAKEANASGFTGSKEGYAGDAQTFGCLFLGK
jgi:hypothetical protein